MSSCLAFEPYKAYSNSRGLSSVLAFFGENGFSLFRSKSSPMNHGQRRMNWVSHSDKNMVVVVKPGTEIIGPHCPFLVVVAPTSWNFSATWNNSGMFTLKCAPSLATQTHLLRPYPLPNLPNCNRCSWECWLIKNPLQLLHNCGSTHAALFRTRVPTQKSHLLKPLASSKPPTLHSGPHFAWPPWHAIPLLHLILFHSSYFDIKI